MDDPPVPSWRDGIVQAVGTVQQERAGQALLDRFGQLAPGVSVVGCRENDRLYWVAVRRIGPQISPRRPVKDVNL